MFLNALHSQIQSTIFPFFTNFHQDSGNQSFFSCFKEKNRSLFFRADTFSALAKVVREWIEYYNYLRLHSSIGYKTPMEISERALLPHRRPQYLYCWAALKRGTPHNKYGIIRIIIERNKWSRIPITIINIDSLYPWGHSPFPSAYSGQLSAGRQTSSFYQNKNALLSPDLFFSFLCLCLCYFYWIKRFPVSFWIISKEGDILFCSSIYSLRYLLQAYYWAVWSQWLEFLLTII